MKEAMQQHMAQMRQMHTQMLWTAFAVIALGVWLASSPVIFGAPAAGGFGPRVAEVTQSRSLAPPELRLQWMAWSDVASGALLVLFGTLSLWWKQRWAQWGTCAVGLWLLTAPLVFWAPTAAAFNNDYLVGAMAIAFSILVPMMPGMDMAAMMAKEDIPPGWDYSPSSWSQRLPIIALGFVGFFIARYLTAYQLGHTASVWDPFFPDGTRTVITSDVSRAWPIPDAGLGAMSYLLECLSGMMGGRQRWRTMPWMVAMFGVLVIPLGGVSIFFIMIQPVMIGTWCTLCLVSAAAMVFMLPYTFDEVVAMGEFLVQARREKQSLWRVFWHGGTVKGARVDDSPPLTLDAAQWRTLRRQAAALPKALIVSAALGAWLMFTRPMLGHEGAMANSDHLTGSMVFVVAVCAWAEVARPLRGLNLLLGAWLVASPWLLDGATGVGTAAVMAAGL
ncbi:MAG: vitamin K epoxide reductase family protein, partial [Rhizobacter sp.]|nr:vitamin K epoxide reductase family protein [Rhizobacter sp.]